MIKWLRHRVWTFKKKKKRRDSPVDWRKVRERTKRFLKKEIRKSMLEDAFDPRGEFILSYCDDMIDHHLDKIFEELVKAWCK